MLRTTSRRSAPSKFSTTPPPARLHRRARRAVPPPGCWPFTTTPVPGRCAPELVRVGGCRPRAAGVGQGRRQRLDPCSRPRWRAMPAGAARRLACDEEQRQRANGRRAKEESFRHCCCRLAPVGCTARVAAGARLSRVIMRAGTRRHCASLMVALLRRFAMRAGGCSAPPRAAAPAGSACRQRAVPARRAAAARAAAPRGAAAPRLAGTRGSPALSPTPRLRRRPPATGCRLAGAGRRVPAPRAGSWSSGPSRP